MRREVKIGLFAVAMIGIAWAGIRFLKGFDILSRNVEYYAAYDQISGVQNASPILIKGVKVGAVTGVRFDPARSDKVVLQFTINRKYRIPTDSEARIFSNGLMGAKAVEIAFGTAPTYLEQGDTLRASRDRDLMDMAGSELEFFKQKVSQLTADLSRTLANVNNLIENNAQNIDGTLANFNAGMGGINRLLNDRASDLNVTLANLAKFSQTLGQNGERIDSIVGGVNRMTTRLDEGDFALHLAQMAGNLDSLLAGIAQGEGTLGLLAKDRALYDSLEQASANLSSLLADLEKYPARYVHFSLFGRDPEKMKAKAEKQQAKAAEKAMRDSLERLR